MCIAYTSNIEHRTFIRSIEFLFFFFFNSLFLLLACWLAGCLHLAASSYYYYFFVVVVAALCLRVRRHRFVEVCGVKLSYKWLLMHERQPIYLRFFFFCHCVHIHIFICTYIHIYIYIYVSRYTFCICRLCTVDVHMYFIRMSKVVSLYRFRFRYIIVRFNLVILLLHYAVFSSVSLSRRQAKRKIPLSTSSYPTVATLNVNWFSFIKF